MTHITWDYIILLVHIVITGIFLYIRWNWISAALSENNLPSSKRLTAFMAVQALLMCEVFHVIKKGELPLYHLISWLAFASICLGLAPILLALIDAWKGNKTNNNTQ